MFFTTFVLCILRTLRLFNLETRPPKRPNNINRKPHRKLTKLKLKFSLILGKLTLLSGFEQPGPGAPLLGSAKSI